MFLEGDIHCNIITMLPSTTISFFPFPFSFFLFPFLPLTFFSLFPFLSFSPHYFPPFCHFFPASSSTVFDSSSLLFQLCLIYVRLSLIFFCLPRFFMPPFLVTSEGRPLLKNNSYFKTRKRSLDAPCVFVKVEITVHCEDNVASRKLIYDACNVAWLFLFIIFVVPFGKVLIVQVGYAVRSRNSDTVRYQRY